MLNFSDMFGKIKEMQAEMEKTREKLEFLTVEASAGGGMVTVTANGNRKILKVKIDPDIIDKNDPELMEDLIAAAVNIALEEAEKLAREEIAKVSQNAMPNIPGLDMSQFGM